VNKQFYKNIVKKKDKKYGAAIRYSSVLTNAKLDVGNSIHTSNCGKNDRRLLETR